MRLIVSKWTESSWSLPQFCQQIDTKNRLHKRGAITCNLGRYSLTWVLVKTD